MQVYLVPLARHKVMVFLDDWFISVGFKSLRRLPLITNGLAYIAAQDKTTKTSIIELAYQAPYKNAS